MECPWPRTHWKYITNKKKLSSEPSGKGHTSPSENVAREVFYSEYKMSISFQASVATSQDSFFKIL